jgi:hypothetical protein
MHVHQTSYTHGDTVYLRTDPMQLARMVVAFTIRPGGVVYYELACGADSSFHFEIEMSAVVDVNLKMGIEVEK